MLNDKVNLIKDIPDNIAQEMYKELVPVINLNLQKRKGFTFENMSKIDPKNVAYTWVKEKLIPLNGWLDGCLEHSTIISYHLWGFYGFFKPSLYEVYCAIYNALGDNWKDVKYFYLESNDMGTEHIIGNYHWCILHLWTKEGLYKE